MSRREADLAEFERLTADLDKELQYCETLDWSNVSLEATVESLKDQLHALERNQHPADDDALEWKTRYESQVALNADLDQQKQALSQQQASLRNNIKEVYKIDMMFPEYEKYTETELIKLLKQLERQKQDLISQLKNVQYQTDKESKDFHHYDELRRTYRADIGITNRDLEHLRSVRRLVEKDAPVSPITSPGTLRWNNKDGITSNQRILDPKRGPVNRTAGVRSLPRVEDRPAREGPPRQQGGSASQSDSPAAEKRSGRARNLPKMETTAASEKKAPPKEKPNGSKPNGSKPSVSKPSGSKPSGSKPSGSKPSGSKPSESKPAGKK
ncbi:coiled-coil domain-containing protein 169-like isoform X2 [Amphibalanus amphitrite]|uniref:coiled-coil domain-containing protein 169-like isoform X2 n=1 Tax=Amphibalanus amphitrite TaxID=1232801 RepID=UPI001C92707E|nr:coiled-coil domain-containing protein 169-like isoform X2 [Amphibalanus amphitrite]